MAFCSGVSTLNILVVLSFASSCGWCSYSIYLANIFWLTLCWTLLQEASLVQVPPQLLQEAGQDFSGQQECICICSLISVCITLPFRVFLHSSRVCVVPKSWHFCKLVVCVWYKKCQGDWLEIAIKTSMMYFILLNEIAAVDPPTCWSKESVWKCLHSMCVYCQSPSGFVWLFWCVQFLIWCFLVTFPVQGQSPNKDWHMLMEGGVGREMVLLCPLFELESCPCKITPAGVWKR